MADEVREILPEEILSPVWSRFLGTPDRQLVLYAFEKDDIDIFLLTDGLEAKSFTVLRKPPPPELKPTWRQRLGVWIHG